VKTAINGSAKPRAIKLMLMAMVAVISKVALSPLAMRCILFAPIFWPTKVERAAEKFMAGIEANESIRMAME
jgi:hypothetical protein